MVEECGIFPHLREFLVDFKWKMRETEVGPPRIKFRPALPHRSSLGATSSSFGKVVAFLRVCAFADRLSECAYVIRFIEFRNREGKYPWPLRQYAVYHKYSADPSAPCSTWILFGSSQRSERYFDQYLNDFGETHQHSPYEMHLQLFDVAIASWRPYLNRLYDRIEDLVSLKCVELESS